MLPEPASCVLCPPRPGDQNQEEDSDDDKDLTENRTSIEKSSESRLTQEFDLVCTLGKGGFGDVLKVIMIIILHGRGERECGGVWVCGGAGGG